MVGDSQSLESAALNNCLKDIPDCFVISLFGWA
jgi:hypothetical protein